MRNRVALLTAAVALTSAVTLAGGQQFIGGACGASIANACSTPTFGGGGGSSTANIWVDLSGGTCTRNSSPAAYNDASACATISAAWTAAQGGDTIVAKGGTYSSAFSASGSKASTVTISSASGENAWFAADGTLSGVTNMTVTDERPPNINTEAGIGNGLTMGYETINSASASILFNGIDISCQNSSPWPHQLIGGSGSSCSAPIQIGGVDGFTMKNGSVGPTADCQDTATTPACSGTRTDINKITGCGSSNANCNNITFDKVLFHDNANLDGSSSGHVHHEVWKIDQGQNISFIRNRFVRCPFGTGGCDTAVISMAQSGTNPTPDFVSFIGNTISGGNKGIAQTRCAPTPCDATITFKYNTVENSLSLCGSGCASTTYLNTTFIGNIAFRQNFQGCTAGAYANNIWYDTGGSPTPARCAATGGNGTADNVGLSNPVWSTLVANEPALDYHTTGGSALLNNGGTGCYGVLDYDGDVRNSGSCNVGSDQ